MARPPVCDFRVKIDRDEQRCTERGTHFCGLRGLRVVRFFSLALVHTKGRWARKPFVPSQWQQDDLIYPVFAPVEWSNDWECYRRAVSDAYYEVARKNGKSEFDAGLAITLTCADDEESAEVYGCACDIPQARKVYDVAKRMVELSSSLSKRLEVKESARRIIDPTTGSYYEVVPADAAGNLGHNPHGAVLDEAITQPSGDLWEALTTAEGTRVQPLFIRTTTAGADPASWAAKEHGEAERIAEDPHRAPHRYVYIRQIPRDADIFDEKNWPQSNPALGEFKSIESMRRRAIEAKNDPSKENAFRQFQGNQWVQQVTRWMPLHLWDATAGLVDEEELVGERFVGGLDLASTTDLAAWVLWFPKQSTVLWRFWTPEAQLRHLDSHTGGQASVWARQGLLTTTEGDWIDFDVIQAQMEADLARFSCQGVGYDKWGAASVVQWLQRNEVEVTPITQGYALSPALKELMRMVKAAEITHGGHPVARWNADSAEVRRDDNDNIKLVKPDRAASGKRVDAVAALAMALDESTRRPERKARRAAGF